MASEHAFLVYKFKNRPNPATTELRRSVYFKGMVVAIAVAFTTILVRCIYRVAEMVGWWRNSLMQGQALFIVRGNVKVPFYETVTRVEYTVLGKRVVVQFQLDSFITNCLST